MKVKALVTIALMVACYGISFAQQQYNKVIGSLREELKAVWPEPARTVNADSRRTAAPTRRERKTSERRNSQEQQ